jgi:hypothetical protein
MAPQIAVFTRVFFSRWYLKRPAQNRRRARLLRGKFPHPSFSGTSTWFLRNQYCVTAVEQDVCFRPSNCRGGISLVFCLD